MADKEYTIFITCKGGKTYNINTYKSYFEARNHLEVMIGLEKERHRPYYVHNDFYKNEYPAGLNCKIFCIKERFVSNWEIYSDIADNSNNTLNNVYEFPKRFQIYS